MHLGWYDLFLLNLTLFLEIPIYFKTGKAFFNIFTKSQYLLFLHSFLKMSDVISTILSIKIMIK